MIIPQQCIGKQITEVLQSYPDLYIVENTDELLLFRGSILVFCSVDDFTLRKKYNVELFIPLGDEDLPYVIDCDKSIKRSYPHIYQNGRFCLETDISVRYRFANGFSIKEWVEEFVEPYFISYEYYVLYGQFPCGERSHNVEGVLQSYQDIFNTDDYEKTYDVARFVRDHPYRGHTSCPCGSGKRLRHCHRKQVWPFYNNDSLKKQLLKDVGILEEQLHEYQKRNYSRAAK